MKLAAQQTGNAGTSPIPQLRERIADALARINAHSDPAVWIYRAPAAELERQIKAASARKESGEAMPLFGLTLAVKDNIDVAGMPTTCACPSFAFMSSRSATAVQKLIDAGAIVMGKTNMDQFATGLVGTRSPYGACKNVCDSRYISGGSSSGSAVAVGAGLVDFALGTDTAGSGRVPAAFNNIVGLKPTRGLISNSGVFPACRSLDCVSIFARTVELAEQVFEVARGFDSSDVYSRMSSQNCHKISTSVDKLRLGIPHESQLNFFGNDESRTLYFRAVDRAKQVGHEIVSVDFSPFANAARLLYEGPWLAERFAAIKTVLATNPDTLLPLTRQIISRGERFSAVDAFEGTYQLLGLRRQVEVQFDEINALLLPTAGTIYTIAEVEADPIALNQNLGYYTNFVNLLDLCAIALPAGFQSNGLPFGISLLAPAGADLLLTTLGRRFLREELNLSKGASL